MVVIHFALGAGVRAPRARSFYSSFAGNHPLRSAMAHA